MRHIIHISKHRGSEFCTDYFNLLAIDVNLPVLCITIAMR